jgi:transposase
VTLALLWQEYKAEHPDGYQYSQFAELYRRFEKKLSVVLRQPHRAGEKVFVDFCDGISLVDAYAGEIIPTQLFVGALGASSYTFAIDPLQTGIDREAPTPSAGCVACGCVRAARQMSPVRAACEMPE